MYVSFSLEFRSIRMKKIKIRFRDLQVIVVTRAYKKIDCAWRERERDFVSSSSANDENR